jgi:predicted Zn-dependent protease with MMP-like domain
VVIIVRAKPASRDKGLLGLYEGVPLLRRGQSYSGAMPDRITLYKDNIEASCGAKGDIKREIRDVLTHEISHHFGMTDRELRQKGLY